MPSQVVSVDISIDPPSFGVQLEATGAIRETEAPRLRPRQAGDAAPPPTQPETPANPAAVNSSTHAVANGAQHAFRLRGLPITHLSAVVIRRGCGAEVPSSGHQL